jgi:hypothetical protein
VDQEGADDEAPAPAQGEVVPKDDVPGSEPGRSHGPGLLERLLVLPDQVAADIFRVLPLLGLGLYGVLRLSLALFYSKLGFSPEEVGFGYAQTIAWSVYGIVGFGMLFAAADYGVPLIGALVAAAIRRAVLYSHASGFRIFSR